MWLVSPVTRYLCCCQNMLKQHWVWWKTWHHPHAHLVGVVPPWSCTEPRIQDSCVYAWARGWPTCHLRKHQHRSGSWRPLTTWHMLAPLHAPWPHLDSKCWSTLQGRTFALHWMTMWTIHQRATLRESAITLAWVTGKSLWLTHWSLETLIMTRVWGVTSELTLTFWRGLCAMIGPCRSCTLWSDRWSSLLKMGSQLQSWLTAGETDTAWTDFWRRRSNRVSGALPFTRWTSMERRSWFTQIAAGQMPRTWNRRPVSACSAPVSLWTPWMAMLQAYLTGDPIGSRGSAVRLWRQRLWQWMLAWTPGSFAGSSWARCWSRATSPLHTSGRLPSDFLPVIGVTDCRSLYGLLVKDVQPSTAQEKRLTIDINGLKEAAMEGKNSRKFFDGWLRKAKSPTTLRKWSQLICSEIF